MISISLNFIRRRRLTIEVRQRISLGLHVSILLGALFFGIGVCIAILLGRGVELSSIYEEFIVFTFFDSAGISSVIVESIPLVLVGLAAAVAFRVNFLALAEFAIKTGKVMRPFTTNPHLELMYDSQSCELATAIQTRLYTHSLLCGGADFR